MLMETTDFIGLKIESTLADIKGFLDHDVNELLDSVSGYQMALAVAMKKGERIAMKLHKIGSQNTAWGQQFAHLATVQHMLNDSHAAWISAMKDEFVIPMKVVFEGGLSNLKQKSKQVQSALQYFEEEQEKSRNIVQGILSRPNLFGDVQSYFQYYDEMKTKEELFAKKRHEILKDVEFFHQDIAHQIALLWAQICSQQPHLPDQMFVNKHSFARPDSPSPSDWASYSQRKKMNILADMFAEDPKKRLDRKKSLVSLCRGFRNIFQWHAKEKYDDMLKRDLRSSTGSAGSAAEFRAEATEFVSPYNASVLAVYASNSEPPTVHHLRPPPLPVSPIASTLPHSNQEVGEKQKPALNSPSSYTDSPICSTTSPPSSSTMSCNSYTSVQYSPSTIFEHFSPCIFLDSKQSPNTAQKIQQLNQRTQKEPKFSPAHGPSKIQTPKSSPPQTSYTTSPKKEETSSSRYTQRQDSPPYSQRDSPSSSENSREYEGDYAHTSASGDSIITMIPDSVETISDASSVTSFLTDYDDDKGSQQTGDDESSDYEVRPRTKQNLGIKTITRFEEWVPRTSKSGRIIYVKKVESQAQKKK